MLVVTFSFPGMCWISNSNSCNASVHLINLPFVSRHCFRNVSARWSICTIVRCPMRYCLNLVQQYTSVSASISVVLYHVSAGFKVLLAYPNVGLCSSAHICNSSPPMATFDASVLRYNGLLKSGNSIITFFINACFDRLNACFLHSHFWFFLVNCISGSIMFAKLLMYLL